MITSIRKIIGIGSSDGVTLPAKELKRAGIKRGDEVEVVIRPVSKRANIADQAVIDAARKVLHTYKRDFDNLAGR
ncbi:hypothetical protein JNM87_03015 [Candidatus Saccharibacteria bacterium]|nr:hypothetical protein [Candidatus Saccharibacteria bacterium]